MTRVVAFVAEVLVEALLEVAALPVSSNSTVMEKVCEGGVIVEEILAAVSDSVAAPVVVKDGAQLVPIPPRPAGNDAAPVFTHHS
jgi:hypothetical protein